MTSTKDSYQREQLIGHWYRSDSDENGVSFSEHAKIIADGRYEFTFIEHEINGDILDQSIELGDWGLVEDIHFTTTKAEVIKQQQYAADLTNADNYHAYRVLTLTNQIFEYQHIVTNEVFILRRVIDNIASC